MRGFSPRNLKYIARRRSGLANAKSCSKLLHKFRRSTTACFSTRCRIAEPDCGT